MKQAAALWAALLFSAVPARAANPSLSQDFQSMTQWLSHEMAQGLAFNAGSNFDPPREIKGWAVQPDVSLGIGRIPFNKTTFPSLTVPALEEKGGSNIFPNQVLFPNLALHLRMGLPGRRDAYFRFADATTPPGYKISPTMTAQVQTNSYGVGVRQHFFGEDDKPTLSVGGHYNHVRGRTRLKGLFNVDIDNNFKADSELTGAIDWSINSFGLDAIVHKNYDAWTPFFGFGYNYATGSVRSRLELKSRTFLISDVVGEGSEHPEQSQGRWITGVQYARPTWSFFFNAEVKALGQLQYRSWIAQAGFALPYELFRGPAIIYKKKAPEQERQQIEDIRETKYDKIEMKEKAPKAPKSKAEPKRVIQDRPQPKPATKPDDQPQPSMIFLQ